MFCLSALIGHRGPKYAYLLCFAAGLMPYAKIQCIPLAATLALFAFIELYKRSLLRPMLTCVAAGLLGTVFVGIDLYYTNLFTDFYYAYIRFNLGYSSLFRELRWDIPVRLLLEADKRSDVFNLFFFLGFTLFAVFGLGIRLLRVRRWNRPVLYALILLVVAWFSIIRSGQSFHHYLFLFFAPLFWGLGIVIGETASGTASRPWAVAVVFLYTVFFGLTLFSRNKGIECAHAFQKPADPLISAIQSLARPSDRVSIWGHGDLARLHCYTGLLPGTRDVFASRQINPSGLQPYFLERYRSDLHQNPPRFLVEDTGYEPYQLRLHALDASLLAGYQLHSVYDQTRLYVRKNDRKDCASFLSEK